MTYNVYWHRVILTRSFTFKPCMKQCCDYSLVERFQKKKKKREEKNSRSYSHSFQSLKRKQKYLQIRVSSATDYLNYWQNKTNIFWCQNTVKPSLSTCEHFLWTKTKGKSHRKAVLFIEINLTTVKWEIRKECNSPFVLFWNEENNNFFQSLATTYLRQPRKRFQY